MCGKWRRACDHYVWEVEKATWRLCVGSGGHVTTMPGKWRRRRGAYVCEVEKDIRSLMCGKWRRKTAHILRAHGTENCRHRSGK